MWITLKMTCLGVLERGERGDDNETGLKVGVLIEMSTTVLHSRAALSLLNYLPVLNWWSIIFLTFFFIVVSNMVSYFRVNGSDRVWDCQVCIVFAFFWLPCDQSIGVFKAPLVSGLYDSAFVSKSCNKIWHRLALKKNWR